MHTPSTLKWSGSSSGSSLLPEIVFKAAWKAWVSLIMVWLLLSVCMSFCHVFISFNVINRLSSGLSSLSSACLRYWIKWFQWSWEFLDYSPQNHFHHLQLKDHSVDDVLVLLHRQIDLLHRPKRRIVIVFYRFPKIKNVGTFKFK